MRSRKLLQAPYSAPYAFVGAGSHALQNLYPILLYLGIPLKYICCKSPGKLSAVERRFGVTATVSFDDILNDADVKGVFICASPQSHFALCKRAIDAGKYVFVEKPPCLSSDELNQLIEADSSLKAMAGMQKRHSPYIKALKTELAKNSPISYSMAYRTGAYPEGNAVTELFIHPIDLCIHLFGNAVIKDFHRVEANGSTTIQMLLSHAGTIGLMELSSAYSWSRPEESLRINTPDAEYRLTQMDRLSRQPHPKKIFGVPLDKAGLFTPRVQVLAERSNFSPLAANNQLVTQGFLSEIENFANLVEHSGENAAPLSSLKETYRIMDLLQA